MDKKYFLLFFLEDETAYIFINFILLQREHLFPLGYVFVHVVADIRVVLTLVVNSEYKLKITIWFKSNKINCKYLAQKNKSSHQFSYLRGISLLKLHKNNVKGYKTAQYVEDCINISKQNKSIENRC